MECVLRRMSGNADDIHHYHNYSVCWLQICAKNHHGCFTSVNRCTGHRRPVLNQHGSRGMARHGHRKKTKVKVKPFDPGPLQNPEKYGELSIDSLPDDESHGDSSAAKEEGLSHEDGLAALSEFEGQDLSHKVPEGEGSKNGLSDCEENPEETETWGISQSTDTVDKSLSTEKVGSQRLDHIRSGARIDFRRLRDWEEVREVVHELGDNIEPRHISHALGALKVCSPRPAREFLEEMAEIAIRNVRSFPPMDLAIVIHSFAKLKFVHKPMISAWEEELKDPEILEACTDIDISTIAYSAGVLHREMAWGLSGRERDQAAGFSREFVKLLAEEAAHPLRVEHYSEAMLSNTFYGLALLRCQDRDALNKLLVEASLPNVLPGFTAQNLASFIYSMGVAGHKNNAVLKTFLNAVLERVNECSEQGLSNIVYALGQLRFTDREAIKSLWPVVCQEDRLMAYTEQDLSNIVHGLGMLGIDSKEVLDPIKAELLREGRLKEFRERGLTGMLYALGQIRHNDMTLLSAIVKELTGTRLKGCKPQGLAVAMYSLGVLKYTNMKDLNPLFYEVSQPQRVSMFSEQELMNVIYGLGHLRHKDEDIIIPLAEEATSPHRLRAFNQQTLATIAHTFANLSFRHHHFLDKIAVEVCKPDRLSDFTEQSFVLTVAAFVRLGHFDKDLFTTFLDECVSPERMPTMRMNPFADTMFGCLKSDSYDLDKFHEIIQAFRDPDRLSLVTLFPLARMLLACGQLGLRDDEFLKNVRTELLKPERVESLRDDDKRDLGRAFERLGWFDEDLTKIVDYPVTGRGMGSYRRPQPRGGDGADEDDGGSTSDYARDRDLDSNLDKEDKKRSGRGVGRGRGDVDRGGNVVDRWQNGKYPESRRKNWGEDDPEENNDGRHLGAYRGRAHSSRSRDADSFEDRYASSRDSSRKRDQEGYFLEKNSEQRYGQSQRRGSQRAEKNIWSEDESSDEEGTNDARSSRRQRTRKGLEEEYASPNKGQRASRRRGADWKSHQSDDDPGEVLFDSAL